VNFFYVSVKSGLVANNTIKENDTEKELLSTSRTGQGEKEIG
jgi:hypothetical protein